MTTTLEKKSPEIQAFVASLGIRIRRNTRDGANLEVDLDDRDADHACEALRDCSELTGDYS